MIIDIIPTNDFAFVHSTMMYSVDKILKDGYLHPSKVTENENFISSDSVFMGFLSPNNKAPVDNFYKYEVLYILKPEIYKDYKDVCFFNDNWNYGEVSENTVYYKDFDEYTEDEVLQLNLNNLDIVMKDKKKNTTPPFPERSELVVRSSISLDKYLIGIINGYTDKKFVEYINEVKINNPKYKEFWINDNPKLQKSVEKYVNLKKFRMS